MTPLEYVTEQQDGVIDIGYTIQDVLRYMKIYTDDNFYTSKDMDNSYDKGFVDGKLSFNEAYGQGYNEGYDEALYG